MPGALASSKAQESQSRQHLVHCRLPSAPCVGVAAAVGDARVLAALPQVPVTVLAQSFSAGSSPWYGKWGRVPGPPSEILEWVGGFPSLPSSKNTSEMRSAWFLRGVGGREP